MNYNIDNLKHTIEASVSPFHTAKETICRLKKAGFTELSWEQPWNIEQNKKYYTCPFGTTVFAFRTGKCTDSDFSVKLASAHIDNPGLRIKYNPVLDSHHTQRLNVEVYGGAIYNSWFDRPLSIAGSVALKNSDSLFPQTKLIDFRQPVAVVPSLAIHLNRDVNKGVAINPQTELLPVCGTNWDSPDNAFFMAQIASQLNEDPENILCYDLCLYNAEAPQYAGFEQEMLLAPRIDNLSSVQACLTGIIENEAEDGLQIIALFDHEEIGSKSKNGANSNLLSLALERFYNALGITRETFLKNLKKSCYLSLDVAHAINPNHPEKSDITTQLALNQGFAVKCSAKHSYCSDSRTTGMILQLAGQNNIPCQPNYMRSDIPGGSTVGPIVSSLLPMPCADIGIPIYAMHSAMETCGVRDQYYLEQFMKTFFSTIIQ